MSFLEVMGLGLFGVTATDTPTQEVKVDTVPDRIANFAGITSEKLQKRLKSIPEDNRPKNMAVIFGVHNDMEQSIAQYEDKDIPQQVIRQQVLSRFRSSEERVTTSPTTITDRIEILHQAFLDYHAGIARKNLNEFYQRYENQRYENGDHRHIPLRSTVTFMRKVQELGPNHTIPGTANNLYQEYHKSLTQYFPRLLYSIKRNLVQKQMLLEKFEEGLLGAPLPRGITLADLDKKLQRKGLQFTLGIGLISELEERGRSIGDYRYRLAEQRAEQNFRDTNGQLLAEIQFRLCEKFLDYLHLYGSIKQLPEILDPLLTNTRMKYLIAALSHIPAGRHFVYGRDNPRFPVDISNLMKLTNRYLTQNPYMEEQLEREDPTGVIPTPYNIAISTEMLELTPETIQELAEEGVIQVCPERGNRSYVELPACFASTSLLIQMSQIDRSISRN